MTTSPTPDLRTKIAAIVQEHLAPFYISLNFSASKMVDAITALPELAGSGAAAKDMLKRMEWCRPYSGAMFCPICSRLREAGHASDCRLAAVLFTSDPVPAPQPAAPVDLWPGLEAAARSLLDDLDRTLRHGDDFRVIHATNQSVKRLRAEIARLSRAGRRP